MRGHSRSAICRTMRVAIRIMFFYSIRLPGRYNARTSPKHPCPLLKCRLSASRLLNVFLHPPTIAMPSYSKGSSWRTSAGIPCATACVRGNPQHTQSSTSVGRVCVVICRLRSGDRLFFWTYGQCGHFQRLRRPVGVCGDGEVDVDNETVALRLVQVISSSGKEVEGGSGEDDGEVVG